MHYEKDEVIFNEGDIGDFLYIIVKGKVAVEKIINGEKNRLAEIGTGEFFGEMALLNKRPRNATIRCLETTEVLAIRSRDFGTLIANFNELRKTFEKTEAQRKQNSN